MRTYNVHISFEGHYDGSIEVPDWTNREEAFKYIKQHLENIPVKDPVITIKELESIQPEYNEEKGEDPYSDLSPTDRKLLRKLDRHETISQSDLSYMVLRRVADFNNGTPDWPGNHRYISEIGGRYFAVEKPRGGGDYLQPKEVRKSKSLVAYTSWPLMNPAAEAEQEKTEEDEPER